MSEVCLSLFYQLREPGRLKPGDPGFEDEEQQDAQRRVLVRIKEIFGLNTDSEQEADEASEPGQSQEGQPGEGGTAPEVNPYPHITEDQWAAREPVRQLLENLLTRQVEIFEAQHRELLRESLAGPSPEERAAEIVPSDPQTKLMQRMEDSNFRQVARITSLLLRLRRHERHSQRSQDPIFSIDAEENEDRQGKRPESARKSPR